MFLNIDDKSYIAFWHGYYFSHKITPVAVCKVISVENLYINIRRQKIKKFTTHGFWRLDGFCFTKLRFSFKKGVAKQRNYHHK